jgi:hypothetical protein
MSVLKIKDINGNWIDIPAFKGTDGAIQYRAGYGINISTDNVISSTLDPTTGVVVDPVPTLNSNNPVASNGVYKALLAKANLTDIPTDNKDLTNGAGYITANDVPKDLSGYTNDIGFLTAESDPFFKASIASSISGDDVATWNRIKEYTLVTWNLNINFNNAVIYNYNYNYKDVAAYNKLLSYAGNRKKAIIALTTNGKNLLFFYSHDSYDDAYTNINYYGTTLDDALNIVPVRLRIRLDKTTNAYYDTTITTEGVTVRPVTRSEVLTKGNTTAFVPELAYDPATKQYVDKAIKDVTDAEVDYIEEDPVFMASVAATITEDDIIRWNKKADNTGGITEELDPTVPEYVKTITEADILNWDNKAELTDIPENISAFNNDAGYITEESDFINSIAARIREEDIRNWNNKQDALEFNTPYNMTTNKVATMLDVSDVANKIPTNLSDLNNDEGFLSEVNASDIRKDTYIEVVSASAKLINPYTKLNKIFVKDGVIDYRNILSNFDLLIDESTDGYASYTVFNGDVAGVQHSAQPNYSTDTYGVLAGVSGNYDTRIVFKPYTLISNVYSSYVVLQQYKFYLLVNEANILNGIEGSYALTRELKTVNVAKYS